MGKFVRVVLAGLVTVVLWATCLDPAYATRPGGARYVRDGGRTSIELDITAASHPQGNVYLLGEAFRSADINFDLGSSFAGELFACDLKDADAANDGTVDAAAGCVSLAVLTADSTTTNVRVSRRFLLLDVNTSEGGSTTSRLTIFGSFSVGSGSGGGVTLVTESTLPVTGDTSLIYRITNATDGGDCAAGTPGTEQADCRWNGTAYEPISQGTAGLANVADDTSPSLGGPLDPNGESIGVRNFYVANDTELASALTSCDAGIGQNKQTGCTIYLEGGQYTMSSTRALAGDGTAAQGRNGLKIVGMGGGYGPANSNQYPNAGTVISWTGGASPMFTMGAGMLTLVDVAIDGNGAATDGVDILNSSGAPNKLHFERVSFYGFTDCAIEGTDGGQFDESTFEHVYIEQSACAIRTSHSQSIGVTLGPKFQVTNMTGSGPFIDVVAGSVLMTDSYCGLVSDGQTCVHFGQGANQARIENTQFEGPGAARTGLVFIDADDGGVNQEVRELIVKDSQFIIGGAGNTALDFLGRGNLVWEDNNFVDTDGSVADSLAVTIDRDSGSANNRLRARIANNWRNNAGTRVPERWLPTIDTTVDVQSPIYSADIRPESCAWWELMRDTNETSGQQLYGCQSGTWVLQGDASSTPLTITNGTVALQGDGTMLFDLDNDNNGSGSIFFRNGANAAIGTIDNTGLASFQTFTSVAGTATYGALAGARGALSLIGGDTAGFALNTYRIMAPLTGTTNVDFYLPNSSGTSGFALTTNGSGTTSWSDMASQAELDAKSAASTNDNRVLRADGASGDVQESAASIDDTGNFSTPGTITSTAGADNSGRKLVLQTNTTGLGAPGAGECALGWVGTTLNQHCNGGSLTPVGGSGGLVAGSQLDALRAKPIYYNDFLGGQSAVNMDPSGFLDFSAVASGTSFIVGDQESLNPQENHPGVIGLLAAAGANSGGAIITGFNGGSKGHFDLDGGEIAEFIFSPKEASGVIIRMGFLDTTDQNDANDGIYLEANGGLAYTCKGANGGTRTTSATVATLTADAWYRGRITVNADKTSATCQIWNEAGVSQGSQAVTTNLPADNVNTNFGAVATHTAGSASLHLLWLDWAALEFTRSLVR